MSKKILTPAAAGEIRRLRDEVDEWGEPCWSGAQIADKLGVSESTVWRVIRKQAAYARVKAAPTPEQIQQSMERTLSMLATAAPEAAETNSSLQKLRDEIAERKRFLEDPEKRKEALLEGLPEEAQARLKGYL